MGNKRNFIVFDTETTGLDPREGHEIVQLSAIAINSWDLEPHPIKPFNAFIKPQFPDKASQGALDVIGPIFDTAVNKGLEPKVVFNKFLEWVGKVNDSGEWISKPIRVGQNVKFDINMTDYWFKHYKVIKTTKSGKDNAPWSYITLDTHDIAFSLFESDPTMNRFNLDALCEKFGLKRKGDYHDAMEDVELTSEIFVRMMRFLRQCKKRARFQNE